MVKKSAQKTTIQTKADLIVIGGGLAGLTLTALMGRHGFKVICLDREKIDHTLKPEFDGRTTAISNGSQKIFAEAGLWPAIEKLSCPIRKIEILDGNSPVLLDFLSDEVGGESFGWIVENRDLRTALLQHIAKLKNVIHITGVAATSFLQTSDMMEISDDTGAVYQTPLVIGADGRNSAVRAHLNIPAHGWSYNQTAIVCCVTHQNPHDNCAIEHFHDQGPFAILPMLHNKTHHQSALVWTLEGKNPSFLTCDENIFNAALAARFPKRYGDVRLNGKRHAFPLSLQHAHAYTGPRTVLIAEAAHAMHPIAGQGLNMGMRDIGALSDLLLKARNDGEDLGSDELLQEFQTQRRFDTFAMMAATDGLNKLFSTSLPGFSPLRKLGVRLVGKMPAAKQFFMAQAMGTAGLVPDKMKTRPKA